MEAGTDEGRLVYTEPLLREHGNLRDLTGKSGEVKTTDKTKEKEKEGDKDVVKDILDKDLVKDAHDGKTIGF